MTAEVLKNTLSGPGKICRDSLPSKKAYCTGFDLFLFQHCHSRRRPSGRTRGPGTPQAGPGRSFPIRSSQLHATESRGIRTYMKDSWCNRGRRWWTSWTTATFGPSQITGRRNCQISRKGQKSLSRQMLCRVWSTKGWSNPFPMPPERPFP